MVAFGVCIGFLPHNLHPARAFMGDAGALFLGLLLAASTMLIGGRTADVSGQTYFFFAPLFIPVFILGVPIADMAFAFIRRTAKGTGFHTRDMSHVHHRLLRLGHGPRRTVAILWAWTAVLSAFLLFPLFYKQGNAVILFGVIVLGLALYTLFHPGLRKDTTNGNGTHATGIPSTGIPSTGIPSTGIPSTGTEQSTMPASNGAVPEPTPVGLQSAAVEVAGPNGTSGGNGGAPTVPGEPEGPRGATPVTHGASRVKYRR